MKEHHHNLLSRLADYYPDRLLSCTFLAVPYSKPAEHFDLDMVNRFTKQLLGFEKCGYIEFFVEDEAGSTLDQHVRDALVVRRAFRLTLYLMTGGLVLHAVLPRQPRLVG